MSTRKFVSSLLLASILGSTLTFLAVRLLGDERTPPTYRSFEQNQQYRLSKLLSKSDMVVPEGLNFVVAAQATLPAVVHIKTTAEAGSTSKGYGEMFKDFFGEDDRYHRRGFNLPKESSGSGVIISDDGFIVTNHHVVKGASQIEVVLDDKRSYTGELIGTDPSTDLALVKIGAEGLPFARYGDSDALNIGEWVLAVGNPLELTSTVTAGIISAKARNINILRNADNTSIESFIQTDAAVNPGNSGGALVNLKGELIGINTAIATTTGAYAGYSFAVPVTIVKKVMDDLLEYGEVQRAILGVRIMEVTAEFARERNLPAVQGVYISSIGEESAAREAEMAEGDVVLSVEGRAVNSPSELQEAIARYRPGDRVRISYLRNEETYEATVTLKSLDATEMSAIASRRALRIKPLGASFEEVPDALREKLELPGGAVATDLDADGKLAKAGVREGFVITSVDKKPVKAPDELEALIKGASGAVLIEGRYPDGKTAFYAIGF